MRRCVFPVFLLLASCAEEAERGARGGACYPNQTCDAGLLCIASKCATPEHTCGDGACEVGEDRASCAADCSASCGDGICNAGESVASCSLDCTPVCGDHLAEGLEVCDGPDLRAESCVSVGYSGGVLGCASNCLTFDTIGCTQTCGDGAIDGGEICDGEDLGGDSCALHGYAGGPLVCLEDCSGVDGSGCLDQYCGSNAIEEWEACDGTDLNDWTCLDFPDFNGGTLACMDDCTGFDLSGCWNATCGNDMKEGDEACDGDDAGGEDCVSLGFWGGGELSCQPGCVEYDDSLCAYSDCDLTGDCFKGCSGCAMNGPCLSLQATCMANQACADLLTCIQGCSLAPACVSTCKQIYADGLDDFNNWMGCVFCISCRVDCAGQGALMGVTCP